MVQPRIMAKPEQLMCTTALIADLPQALLRASGLLPEGSYILTMFPDI